MKYLLIFILFFVLKNSLYTFFLPFFPYSFILIIFMDKNLLIFYILGLINKYLKNKFFLLFSLIFIIILDKNLYFFIPIYLLCFKNFKIENERLFIISNMFISLCLNKSPIFISILIIFLLYKFNKRYSLISSIILYTIYNKFYFLFLGIVNPIFLLFFLLIKSYININLDLIYVYFNIIIYLLINLNIPVINKKNNLSNYFLSLDKYINMNDNFSNNLNNVYNYICKRCEYMYKCIKNKNYLNFIKSTILNNQIDYNCIYKSNIKKYSIINYNKTFIYISKILDNKLLNYDYFNKLLVYLYFLGLNIYNFKIINDKLDNLLIKINYKSIPNLNLYLNPLNLEINKYYLGIKYNYNIVYKKFSYSKNYDNFCGDNLYISDRLNEIRFFLSDGMGSGIKAYNESISLINHIKDLEDINDDLLINLLNSSYELKNTEKYATLDYLYINKINLESYIYKIASSYTFIIRNNDILRIDNLYTPLGFNQEIKSHKLKLYLNDIIILLSDGLGDISDISNIILRFKNENINKMIYDITNYTTNNLNKLIDDISLIIIKIEKRF